MSPHDALQRYITAQTGVLSKKTIKWYLSKLSQLTDYLSNNGISSIEDVTIHHLRQWHAELATSNQTYAHHHNRNPVDEAMQPETRHGYIRAAKRWFVWLTQEEILSANPALSLELPPTPRKRKTGIRPSDRDRILELARVEPRDYAILMFMADTACRVGGVAGMTLENLEIDERRAWVSEKGNKGRYVYFGNETRDALTAYLEIRPGCDVRRVFLRLQKTRHGNIFVWQALTECGIYQMIERYAAMAGVESDWNPHAWRHAALRGMSDNGMPLNILSQIAGHASESTTADIYGTLDDNRLQRAHDRWTWLHR